jgi:aspartate aminotransferase-like enzyme
LFLSQIGVYDLKLFTVGPVSCYPQVLDAMGMQMLSHRSQEYTKIHYDTVARFQDFLETENPVYLFSSTGTGFMEASVLNCIKKSMLVCINGSFGERFAEVGRRNGREVITLEPPLGEPITPELLDESLSFNEEVEGVAITHNETSVGLLNDLPSLTLKAKEYRKLVFVDAVSSMGGTMIKVDEWGIDICFSSSQKCFGVPPGLGIGSVSYNALEKSKEMSNKGWYFDFVNWHKYHEQGRGTPMTSIIPQVAGINAALKLIDEMGGKRCYFELYERRNKKIREGIKDKGLSTYPKKGYESPTVSCFNAPMGTTGPEVYKAMRTMGFELAQGYGALKESTFRIGNMGYIREEDIDDMLETLGDIVEKLTK